MNFAKDFPDKLRANLLLSEVIGKKVRLKQRGKEFIGLCPFHNEKTPSFTVSNQKGLFHCFGCQAGGDAVGFVMKSQNLDFKEAVISLANEFSIAIPYESSTNNLETKKKEQEDYKIAEVINQFFEQNLKTAQGAKARQYLQNRGISPEIIKKFNIGFAPNSFESLTKHLLALGFSGSALEKCGAIGKNDRGQFYDKFRNRIIFPIKDNRGKIIAFGGRTIGDDLPKYLNSSETALFKKSQTLFNLDLAKQSIASKSCAIMVEGYMDVVSLNIFGFENSVAGLGTAISNEHITNLFHYTEKIIICLDGDEAGIRAAKRIADLALPLISSKKSLYFIILPFRLDPDDFLKKYGREAFIKQLSEAKSLSEFLFKNAVESIKSKSDSQINEKFGAEEKAKIANHLALICNQIIDPNSKKFFSLFFKDSLYFLGRNSSKTALKLSHSSKVISFIADDIRQNLGLNIVALLIFCPDLSDYRDDFFELKTCHLFDKNAEILKDWIIEKIDFLGETSEQSIDFKNSENDFYTKIFVELKNSEHGIFFERVFKGFEELKSAFESRICLRTRSKSRFGEPDMSVFSTTAAQMYKGIHRGSEKLEILLKIADKGRDFEQVLKIAPADKQLPSSLSGTFDSSGENFNLLSIQNSSQIEAATFKAGSRIRSTSRITDKLNQDSENFTEQKIDWLQWSQKKLQLFLLKDLLIQINQQYQESILANDIKTKSSEVCDEKITEIFKHKNSLQSMIMALEQEE